MKIPSNDLFELISSLSKNEKIYFKKFASVFSQGKERNYLKLFNEIEKQTSYDEVKIRQKFKNENFIKQLHVTKIYLYNLITKSLYLQSTRFNELSKLREMINQIEVLYRKGLYVQCSKIINKAKQIAGQQEFLIELLRIKYFEIKIERELLHSMRSKQKSLNKKQDLFDDTKNILRLMENEFDLERYNRDVYNYLFKGKLRNKKDIHDLKQLLNEPLLKSEKKALTYTAGSYYYFAKSNAYNIIGDLEKDYKYQKKHIQYMESHPEKLKSRLLRYVKLINNYIISCMENNRFYDHGMYLEKLMKIPTDRIKNKLAKEKLDALIFRIYHTHKLNLSLMSGMYKDSLQSLPEIIKGLDKHKRNIENSFQLVFYLSFALIYFLAEEYDNSLKWVNHILNEKDYEAKEDFYSFALLLNLIIHFELNNFQLLEYATRNTLHHLNKMNRVHRFEKFFIEFIRRYSLEDDEKKRKLLLFEIKSEIESITGLPEEKLQFEFFDYLLWIDAKIRGENFAKILTVKFNSKIKKY